MVILRKLSPRIGDFALWKVAVMDSFHVRFLLLLMSSSRSKKVTVINEPLQNQPSR